MQNPYFSTETEPRFSFYKPPVTNIYPSKTITLFQCAQMIELPYPFQVVTDEFRTLTDEAEKRSFKAKKLSYVTFSGVFNARKDELLIAHSGLMVIDLDHLEEPEITKKVLARDDELDPAMIFTSPSGNGLKMVLPIDVNMGSHQDYFDSTVYYLSKTYGLQADLSGREVSRACFLCHDPALYLNPSVYAFG